MTTIDDTNQIPSSQTCWNRCWQRRWFRTLLIFSATFLPLLLIDQLSKGLIFNNDQSSSTGQTLSNWGFIAFRSQFHTSTTFLDAIGRSWPTWLSLMVDYLLLAIFVLLIIWTKNKWITATLSIIMAGILGNTIDATHFGGVRNVMFIPYNDNGTFNFADVFIVGGAILTALGFFYELFNDYRKGKKKVATDSEPRA